MPISIFMSHDEITFRFFLLDRRDDQELFTGDFISKIIVPHPALNFPKNITVTYQVYRGWLTRGLSSWSINKVVLSDSFGESYSLCKATKLESGKPHRMTLQPGDCHEEELALLAAKAIQDAIAKIDKSTTTSSPQSSTAIYPTFNATSDVIELGKHIPLERNETESTSTTAVVPTTTDKPAAVTASSNASWVPILTASKLDSPTNPAVTTNTSDIDEKDFLNLGERMPKKAKTEKRSFGESSEDDLMNSVPVRDDSSAVEEPIAEDDVVTLADDEIDNKFVTVQLFQYRLGDVFEKAEKYARNTLFPLLSEQISNIFNFEGVDKDGAESTTDTPVVVRPAKSQRKYDTEPDIDYRSLQTIMGLQVNDYIKPIEKMYNNYQSRIMDAEAQALKQEEDKIEVVRISLPTYRPEVIKNEKIFIPIERDSS